jgi:hypothetical protein
LTATEICFAAAGLALDLALAALPLLVWRTNGRDPHYTDDDSVLMPSPPPEFSPALASVVLKGKATRSTISAGLMDLASHNLIAFHAEAVPVGHRAGIMLTTHRPHHLALPAPEAALYQAIVDKTRLLDRIDSIFLSVLNEAFTNFTRTLDDIAVQRGWLRNYPTIVIRNWRIIAAVEAVAGVLVVGWVTALFGPTTEPTALEVAFVGMGGVIAAAITFFLSAAMPARTGDGAQLAAWLSAYRRTLEATISQSESLEQVVEMKPLPWVGTPTEEIAWAVAFGLDRQIDSLLSQSLEVSQTGGWPTGIRDWFSVI